MIFHPREKFLILNVAPAGASKAMLGVDDDKNVRLERTDRRFTKFLDKLSTKKLTAVINIHPRLGAVRIIPFRFVRQGTSVPLELTELENFLAQLAQKSNLELRSDVARELGTEELDAILVETKPFAYRSDGSSVSSPLGHRSREIHGFLEMLFTTREGFDQMQEELYAGNPVFMTVHDKSELMSLKKLGKIKFSFLEFSDDGGARLLKYDLENKKGEYMTRRSINWSPSRFMSRLEELWNVDTRTAKRLYAAYLNDELSPKLRAQLEKIWKEEIGALFTALKSAGGRGEIYLKTSVPLPASFPARQKGITLLEFPTEELFDKLGFNLGRKQQEADPLRSFAQLAPFIECYYDNSDPEVTHSLRRRIHWLIS